jgi:hypothetical protein
VLKATEAGDVTTYAFIFDGGDLDADWELRTLMPAHYGSDEADRLLSEAEDTYAPFREWVATLATMTTTTSPRSVGRSLLTLGEAPARSGSALRLAGGTTRT